MLRSLIVRRPWRTLRETKELTRHQSTQQRRHVDGSRDTPVATTRASEDQAQDSIRQGVSFIALMIGSVIVGHTFAEHIYSCNHAYGISMLPTINSYGDWLIMSKWYRRGRGIQVGDIVGFTHPMDDNKRAAKRVIGMPGDFVLRDTPGHGEGHMIQLPEGHCWVTGDNLSYSRDSRAFGPLPLALVTGKVIGIVNFKYPFIKPSSNPFIKDEND